MYRTPGADSQHKLGVALSYLERKNRAQKDI